MKATLSELTVLFDQWDGEFESAELLLEKTMPLFATLQESSLDETMLPEMQHLISEYQKLIKFLQQEKGKVQREAAKLNQANQKMRDYVKFNQSSGYEFYY